MFLPCNIAQCQISFSSTNEKSSLLYADVCMEYSRPQKWRRICFIIQGQMRI